MDRDDGESGPRCVSVPEELVTDLVSLIIDFLDEWHKENDLEPSLDVCGAAVLVSAKMITARFMGYPAGPETLQ